MRRRPRFDPPPGYSFQLQPVWPPGFVPRLFDLMKAPPRSDSILTRSQAPRRQPPQ